MEKLIIVLMYLIISVSGDCNQNFYSLKTGATSWTSSKTLTAHTEMECATLCATDACQNFLFQGTDCLMNDGGNGEKYNLDERITSASQGERFANLTCMEGYVVVKSAKFSGLKVCVEKASAYAKSLCEGERDCQLQVDKNRYLSTTICPDYNSQVLEVAYRCVSGTCLDGFKITEKTLKQAHPFLTVPRSQGLNIGGCMKIRAKISDPPPDKFTFAFERISKPADIAFLMSPRFDHTGDVNVTVFNSYLSRTWGSQVRELQFPFTPGVEFTVKIAYSASSFVVHVNGDMYKTVDYPFSDLSDIGNLRVSIENNELVIEELIF